MNRLRILCSDAILYWTLILHVFSVFLISYKDNCSSYNDEQLARSFLKRKPLSNLTLTDTSITHKNKIMNQESV